MTIDEAYERGLDVTQQLRGQRLELPMGKGEPESGLDLRKLMVAHTFGDSWTRTALDERTRALVTVTMSATLGTQEPLRGHLRIALGTGVSKDEIVDLFIQLAVYVGAARAFEGYQVALEVFAEREDGS